MNKKSNIKITVLFALSVGLIAAAATACLLTIYYRQVCFHLLGGFCERMIEKNPDSRQAVLELLKTQDFLKTGETIPSNKFDNHVLSNFGYSPSKLGSGRRHTIPFLFLVLA